MGYSREMGKIYQIHDLAHELGDYLENGYRGEPLPEDYRAAVGQELDSVVAFLSAQVAAVKRGTFMRFEDYVRKLVGPDAVSEATVTRRGIFVKAAPSDDRLAHNRALGEAYTPETDEPVPFVAYVDSGRESVDENIVKRFAKLASAFGFDDQIGLEIRRGSLFQSWRSKAAKAVTSEDVVNRLVKVERGLELAYLDKAQAEVDQAQAQAVASLIHSLQGTPTACLRAGSILLLKFQQDGEPVVLMRNLSQFEMKALERYPEIQANPAKALEMLATAVDSLQSVPQSPELNGPQPDC